MKSKEFLDYITDCQLLKINSAALHVLVHLKLFNGTVSNSHILLQTIILSFVWNN
jgi:hypothetical protein